MLQAIIADFSAYFRKITEDRRQNPRDDLATVIANAKNRRRLYAGARSDQLLHDRCDRGPRHHLILDRRRDLWRWPGDPVEFAKVKANPDLIPGLVDEAIRWMTPVKHFMRSATADTELGGRKIAKGDWLMLCYASGNRDEEVFEEPDRFRSDRKPNRHVAFGYGAHLCLGQYLAKLEMRILFEELLPHLKSLSLDGEVKMTQAYFVNGPKKAADQVRGELTSHRHCERSEAIHTFICAGETDLLRRFAPRNDGAGSYSSIFRSSAFATFLQRRAGHLVDESGSRAAP